MPSIKDDVLIITRMPKRRWEKYEDVSETGKYSLYTLEGRPC